MSFKQLLFLSLTFISIPVHGFGCGGYVIHSTNPNYPFNIFYLGDCHDKIPEAEKHSKYLMNKFLACSSRKRHIRFLYEFGSTQEINDSILLETKTDTQAKELQDPIGLIPLFLRFLKKYASVWICKVTPEHTDPRIGLFRRLQVSFEKGKCCRKNVLPYYQDIKAKSLHYIKYTLTILKNWGLLEKSKTLSAKYTRAMWLFNVIQQWLESSLPDTPVNFLKIVYPDTAYSDENLKDCLFYLYRTMRNDLFDLEMIRKIVDARMNGSQDLFIYTGAAHADDVAIIVDELSDFLELKISFSKPGNKSENPLTEKELTTMWNLFDDTLPENFLTPELQKLQATFEKMHIKESNQ